MTDYCVIDLCSQPPRFYCEICQDSEEPELPISLHEAARMGRQFVADHAACAEPPDDWNNHPSLTPAERNPNLK